MKLLKLLFEHINIYIYICVCVCVQCCSSKMFKVIMFVHVRFSGCTQYEDQNLKPGDVKHPMLATRQSARSQIWLDWNHPRSDIVVPHFCDRFFSLLFPGLLFLFRNIKNISWRSWYNLLEKLFTTEGQILGEITSTFGVQAIEWSIVGRNFPQQSPECAYELTKNLLEAWLACSFR